MGRLDEIRKRQQNRRERRKRLGRRIRSLRIDERAARKDFVRIRARIRRLREAGEEVPQELWEERKRRRDVWLKADERLELRREWRRKLQAAIARAYKRARRIRRRRRREEFEFLSRAEWGAAAPRGSYTRNTAIREVIDHHTAQARGTYRSKGDVAARMRSYQRLHLSHGWTDLGYHSITFVMADGSVVVCEGRPAWAVGAHTRGNNTGTVGNCADGYYHPPVNDQPTPTMLAAMKKARTQKLNGGSARVVGHRDRNATACPGDTLYPKIGAS